MKPFRKNLTQERLMYLFNYDAETGVFTRKVRTSKANHVGDVAGCVRPNGYRGITVDGVSYLAHRLAWLYVHGEFPRLFMDHVNRNRDDNRISNLREATLSENSMNRGMQSNNTSGAKGVIWVEKEKRWHAECGVGNRKKVCKTFANYEDALSYVLNAREYFHGEFANHGMESV